MFLFITMGAQSSSLATKIAQATSHIPYYGIYLGDVAELLGLLFLLLGHFGFFGFRSGRVEA